MLGPKIEKKLHCHLTDREVHLTMDPNAAILRTEFNPTSYDMGMTCNFQDECQKREIKCQVYDGSGRFPFFDEEVLNTQSAVLNFRSMANARLEKFRTWTADQLSEAVRGADAQLRREVAFYLRFRRDEPAELWTCVELLIDCPNRFDDHSSRVETIESVAVWLAQERAVPKEKFLILLRNLAEESSPVARRAGEKFVTGLQAFIAEITP